MSKKRVIFPDVYKQRKNFCSSRTENTIGANGMDNPDVPKDVKSALSFLRGLFPVDKFEGRLPPIIMKHQLYSIIKNKTEVDRQLNDLKNNGDIRLFHLGSESDDICIVFAEEFKKHARKINENNPVVDKFLNTVNEESKDLCINKETIAKFHIKDEEMSQLFNAGMLTVRDIGSWWFAIPRAGEFMKCYLRGRKAILLTIKKCKYGEILQNELENRKLPKAAKLGIQYHIHDIVGAELVQCISTTSGMLLRYNE